MANLTKAHDQLFRRSPDECYESLAELHNYCLGQKEASADHWEPPARISARPGGSHLRLHVGTDGAFEMTDWSFSQLCKLAGASKDTVNRLTADTASRVLAETLPQGSSKPLQVFELAGRVRSIHAASYTRLYNADLLSMVREFAVDFQPPQKGFNGATGLYAGEQDLFAFLIDPTGWTEIDGQAFAPGFYLWNSEVGRRSVGVSTFWFQSLCANHIIWDAVEVVEFSRKHTTNVHECLAEVRRIIEQLVARRDERRDGFVRVIKKAMETRLGDDADEVLQQLAKHGIPRQLARRSLDVARQQRAFTIFAVVDALTRLTQESPFAGDRAEADEKASMLLALAE